jgi:hypothetical protein
MRAKSQQPTKHPAGKTTTVRIPGKDLPRIERISQGLEQLVGGQFGTSAVAARALQLGLPVLERKLFGSRTPKLTKGKTKAT